MTDDEILAVANEVLRPAGIANAYIRHPPPGPDGGTFCAISFVLPVDNPSGAPSQFNSGWTIYPKTPALTRDRVLAGAHEAVQFAVKTTATWPTPWVPANRASTG